MDTLSDDLLPTVNWLLALESSVQPLLPDKDECGRACRRWRTPGSSPRASPESDRAAGADGAAGASSDVMAGFTGGSSPEYHSCEDHPAGYTVDGVELDQGRPPYSFTCMIGIAVVMTEPHRLSVGQIYEFLQHSFPYFSGCKGTWRNSVRHVLSLNKFFYKQGAAAADKGALWAVKPAMLDTLLGRIDDGLDKLHPTIAKHVGVDSLRARAESVRRHAEAAAAMGATPAPPGPVPKAGRRRGSAHGQGGRPRSGGKGSRRKSAAKPRRRTPGLSAAAARAATSSMSPVPAVPPPTPPPPRAAEIELAALQGFDLLAAGAGAGPAADACSVAGSIAGSLDQTWGHGCGGASTHGSELDEMIARWQGVGPLDDELILSLFDGTAACEDRAVGAVPDYLAGGGWGCRDAAMTDVAPAVPDGLFVQGRSYGVRYVL